jgi:hypothetical protein
MTLAFLRDFFLWCAVVNYSVILVWFAVFVWAREWLYRFHGRWFALSREQFDALHYGALSAYKIGILLLNVAPYIALCIVDRRP